MVVIPHKDKMAEANIEMKGNGPGNNAVDKQVEKNGRDKKISENPGYNLFHDAVHDIQREQLDSLSG